MPPAASSGFHHCGLDRSEDPAARDPRHTAATPAERAACANTLATDGRKTDSGRMLGMSDHEDRDSAPTAVPAPSLPTVNPEPSRREKVGAWLDTWSPRLGWLVVGVLIAGPVAWWAGAWVGCSRAQHGCEYRADSVEALGTWFGAIGTVAAVLAAVHAFRSEERSRNAQSEKDTLRHRAVERRFAKEASAVTISVSATHTMGTNVLGYTISISNGADTTPIYGLRGWDFSGPLQDRHTLQAGRQHSVERRAGSWAPPVPPVLRDNFASWARPQVTIMFKMNDRLWRRVGNEPVEIIDSWDYDGDFDDS